MVAVAGAQATTTATANTGSIASAMPGSQATVTATANTSPLAQTSGSQATVTATARSGTVRVYGVGPASSTANVVSYALGRPRPAAERGGDCRARDIDQDRNVHGPHRFAATTHCQITNGLLRLTVGVSGSAPSVTVEAWRGRVVIDDEYEDVYSDTYGGEIATPSWVDMGVVTIDSPAVAALLTAAQIARLNPEAVTVRLVAPLMADTYVTLRRGERQCRIQHGNTRTPRVDTDRRARWTASPPPGGWATLGRVTEVAPVIDGMVRFLGAIDPVTVNAAAFSITAPSVNVARMVAGVGTYAIQDRAIDYHRQAGDASKPVLVVA